MKKLYRVKKSNEIENIIRNKVMYGNKYFNVYIKKSSGTNNFRYAISVGKKIGNAVCRNKVKRQLRSLIFLLCDVNQLLDIFIVAKPIINDIDFNEMKKQLKFIFNKLNIKIKGETT